MNSASNPAAPGSIIILHGTGEGPVSPALANGTIVTDLPYPKPAPFTVSINGKSAIVLYAGSAPGLPVGILHINVRLPADLPSDGRNRVAS